MNIPLEMCLAIVKTFTISCKVSKILSYEMIYFASRIISYGIRLSYEINLFAWDMILFRKVILLQMAFHTTICIMLEIETGLKGVTPVDSLTHRVIWI